ncbi:hypothetical protein DI041_14775 [Stenotrophomonas maltophilia]|nr:hypothetical protein DI034_14735 [Stenotrophomonas maltophilia]TIE57957.1 hypothetical protein DI041_14775 [Stenotrophomonas maltophilia]
MESAPSTTELRPEASAPLPSATALCAYDFASLPTATPPSSQATDLCPSAVAYCPLALAW